MDPTDPNFWQIQIIILISHINISLLIIYFSSDMSCKKVDKKQAFCTLDIVESWSKEMGLISKSHVSLFRWPVF